MQSAHPLPADILRGPVLLFDGVCNLCKGSVQFVIKRDARRLFRFASLQSDVGARLVQQFGIEQGALTSVILIVDEKAYRKSSAALRTAKLLQAPWPAMAVFFVVPKLIRDAVYDFIGARRYRWFGKMDECWLPDAELQRRFLA